MKSSEYAVGQITFAMRQAGQLVHQVLEYALKEQQHQLYNISLINSSKIEIRRDGKNESIGQIQ